MQGRAELMSMPQVLPGQQLRRHRSQGVANDGVRSSALALHSYISSPPTSPRSPTAAVSAIRWEAAVAGIDCNMLLQQELQQQQVLQQMHLQSLSYASRGPVNRAFGPGFAD